MSFQFTTYLVHSQGLSPKFMAFRLRWNFPEEDVSGREVFPPNTLLMVDRPGQGKLSWSEVQTNSPQSDRCGQALG